ncbi:DNA/RNA-binding protein KIN17 [Elysia marginata]|uniref:DNA/RNA-binding protein KIN17 n=1 Tax=Elysia marginata TaxID=1093978 RepID=A0AAV4J9D8_9GAST|nr:DNA/RNA-binding protein KIN17 [Elysia marginata]
MSKPKDPIHSSGKDIFGLNKLIIDSFSKTNLGKLSHQKKGSHNTPTTSSATMATSREFPKWPLTRPRVSLPFAAKYRDVNRRLQMKQLLQKIKFDYGGSPTMKAHQNYEIPHTSRKSSLEELKLELETLREQENRRLNWLCQGITVRVVSTRLGKKYLGQTADIIELKQDYTALIKFHRDGSVIYADQNHLQTAILGRPQEQDLKVLIVNGAYRGCTGVVQNRPKCKSSRKENRNTRDSLTITIDKGVFNGRVLRHVQADDVASMAEVKYTT